MTFAILRHLGNMLSVKVVQLYFITAALTKKTKRCCDKQYFEEVKQFEIVEDQDTLSETLERKSITGEIKILKELNGHLSDNRELKEKIEKSGS